MATVRIPPLVGRDLDLAVALGQLERVEGRTAASLLVRGEAGIGKSRLVAELAARAEDMGHRVVAGRADDLDQGIPFAVFRDVLARLAPSAGIEAEADALRAAVDGGPDEPGAEHLSTAFAALRRLLAATGDGRPVVLVLEDLHVADGESLALAALVIRLADLPVLTVATLRPGPGAAGLERLCERMAFDGRGSVIDLEPLDRDATRELVTAVLGAVPDDDLTAAVTDQSRGNPFFAGEVVRSLLEAGALVVEGNRARLMAGSPAVQLRPSTALLRRLFLGSPTDVELAKVMAAFGRFSLRHLGVAERLTGLAGGEVAASFDRLVASGLVAAAADGGYEFTHAIVRATLYEDIGPAERRRIHSAIATELAAERRAGVLLDVLELATHVAASATPGDEGAAQVLLDAGRAVGASAPLVAADYHRRAVELLPQASPRRAEALGGQARALHVGARPREAAAVGQEALATLPPGHPARPATVALVVNDLYLDGRAREALDVVDAELAAGGHSCPLLAIRTNLLLQLERYGEAATTFPAAVASLDASGAPATAAAQLMALSHLVQYANHVGRVAVAADLLRRVDALAGGASRTVALAAHELVAFADWRPGLARRIEQHLTAAAELRRDAAALSIGGSSESARSRLLWMRGEWDKALELIRSAGFDLEQRGMVTTAQLLAAAACEIHVDRGDLDAAAATAARFDAPILSVARHVAIARARIDHALGDGPAALARLDAERAAAAQPDGSVWKLADVLRLEVELHLEAGRAAEAQRAATELEALARRTGWLECQLPALRARALVGADVDAARAYRDLAESETWTVELAHALLMLGELGDDPGHHLAEAYRAFDGFGAAPWRRRAAAGLRSRGLTVPRRAAQPASDLTETEVQLVRLVRDNLTNRQIAAAMHYSPKTIEVYLSRVYAKTGCASRLELIRAVDTGAVSLDGPA